MSRSPSWRSRPAARSISLPHFHSSAVGALPREFADRRMKRPGQHLGSNPAAGVDRLLQPGDGRLAASPGRAISDWRRRRRRQTAVRSSFSESSRLPQPLDPFFLQLEERDLDAVVAALLQLSRIASCDASTFVVQSSRFIPYFIGEPQVVGTAKRDAGSRPSADAQTTGRPAASTVSTPAGSVSSLIRLST